MHVSGSIMLQEELAREVAARIEVQLSPAYANHSTRSHSDPLANEAYLRGQYFGTNLPRKVTGRPLITSTKQSTATRNSLKPIQDWRTPTAGSSSPTPFLHPRGAAR